LSRTAPHRVFVPETPLSNWCRAFAINGRRQDFNIGPQHVTTTLTFFVAAGLTITTVTGGTIDANNLLHSTCLLLDVQVVNRMQVAGPVNGLYNWRTGETSRRGYY
jgi:hypothetical protein